MDYKEIRELSMLMREMGLTALEYSEGGATLKLERAAGLISPLAENIKTDADTTLQTASGVDKPGVFTVKSPMVGVFYVSPSADGAPYVTVGDTVRAGDVLCIIEAMKIMNEITAERDGIVVEVCAENKQVVEFGQPLFRLDTTGA